MRIEDVSADFKSAVERYREDGFTFLNREDEYDVVAQLGNKRIIVDPEESIMANRDENLLVLIHNNGDTRQYDFNFDL